MESVETIRICPVCDGDGCTECGDTGQRVRTTMQVDDITVSIQGDATLSEEARAVLADVARAAFAAMEQD